MRAEPVAPDPGLTYRRSVLVHEDDTTVVQLRRRTCLRLDPRADGRELLIEVGHSVIERVHHVDVDESADEVAVSAWVGTRADVAERARSEGGMVVPLVLVRWRCQVQLTLAVGERTIRDVARIEAANTGHMTDGWRLL